jgi:hypothetical protein
MARILTVTPEAARGPRRLLVSQARREYGGVVPGMFNILLPDLQLAAAVSWLYQHLHLRRRSPLTRLQREMLATVVNGLVGGAP